jgi:hypothetical protein
MTHYEGADAWRNHFSVNAGDLLQVQRSFGSEEVFRAALRKCLMRKSRSERINERTVLAVLQDMTDEEKKS